MSAQPPLPSSPYLLETAYTPPLLREATLICETLDGPTALKLLSHQALLRIPLPDGASRLTLCLESSWGGGDIGLYGCEIMDV